MPASTDVAVFGLGWIGTVMCAGLAERGRGVVGVDPVEAKVAAIAGGASPVIEPGLDDLVAAGVGGGNLRATVEAGEAVAATTMALICVGTPDRGDGTLDLAALERVIRQIGDALRHRRDPYVVVVRSTVAPGTMRGRVVPWLEAAAGRPVGGDLAAWIQPEFLREGDALADFRDPPMVVVGADERWTAERVEAVGGPSGATVVDYETAELVKTASNAFHAVKAAFANEVGSLAEQVGADGRAVMELIRSDTKLNASGAYLTPGQAFGGSCLGKDVSAVVHRGETAEVDLPLLSAVLGSNDAHLERLVERIGRRGATRVGILGLAFKAGTDDLRASTALRIAARLVDEGVEVRWFDPLVDPERVIGANRAEADRTLPGWEQLRCADPTALVAGSDAVVVGHHGRGLERAVAAAATAGVLVDPVAEVAAVE